MPKFSNIKKIVFILFSLFIFIYNTKSVLAQQELNSNSYKIIDSTIDNGGGISESSNYGLLGSSGNSTAVQKLQSSNYYINSGYPSGIQSNVPLIRCVESTTNSGTTNCIDFPNANGAIGECGEPGCYDRAKIEIDPQNNPIDTLYLISFTDISSNTEYFVDNSNTLNSNLLFTNYMNLCQIQGKDLRTGSGCQNSGGPNWSESLQRINIYGLNPGTTYQVKVKAYSGDYTESEYSPIVSVTTTYPSITFDLDIGILSSVETSAPYSIDLGLLEANIVKTATNQIWVDMNTNITAGISGYVKDLNSGLLSGGNLIPSETEDLQVDSNANGGYGLKTSSTSQTSLGPLISNTAIYSTVNSDSVGSIDGVNELFALTNNSGSNLGQISGGRIGFFIKALAKTSTSSGNYSDIITFTLISNL